jgi:two-component system sensor histidine kinase VicK
MAPPHTLAREETLRLRVLDEYQLLGAPADPALEEITRLASDVCDTPFAGISLIAHDSIHLIARVGVMPPRIPRGGTPCELTILGPELFEIPDARYDPSFRPDGILLAGRVLRFYAGVPLLAPQASGPPVHIGCLFVQGSQPQTLSLPQKTALVTLSHQVITRFELNARKRSTDSGEHTRRRVESELTVERNFVSTVLDTVGALVAVYDTAGRIVRFNRACEEASGYEFSSLVGQFFWQQLIPEQDREAAIEQFRDLRAGHFPASFENYWQNRDGSLRCISWSATALVDEQGHPTFIIATGIDVTEQRAAEATLRESEARYRQLVEGSLGIICTHSLEGTILSINQNGATTLGRSVDEMIGSPLTAFMPLENHHAFDRYLHQIARTGEAQGRLQLSARNQDLRTIAFRNKLIEVDDIEPYILAFGVDISEQVRAEEKLRALIHQSNSILESVGDGIYGIDLDGNVTVVNPAAAQMLGYKPAELLGRNLHQIAHHSHPDGSPYPESECLINNTVRTGNTIRVANEVFWRKDGTSFPIEYVARPQMDTQADSNVTGKTPRPVGVVVAFRDTTERRALDRMKDEFISTVSHELRTPLTSLRAALGLVSGGALEKKPEKKQQMLSVALGNTDRLIRLVNDFLDIERISSGNAELHSATITAQYLFDRATSLQQAAAEKNDLHFDIRANNVTVYADPDRMLQALTNLISNAIKFSPPRGTIFLTANQTDENEARFVVHDQGRGIPQDKLETIFERFHQVDASDSREMGGTGLGLAICRSIIQQHGGRIWATSPAGHGAFFHFTLPIRPSSHLR